MGVVEAGNHGVAGEIPNPGLGAHEGGHVLVGAHRQDARATNGDGLRPGSRGVHRVHDGVPEDEVGGLRPRGVGSGTGGQKRGGG